MAALLAHAAVRSPPSKSSPNSRSWPQKTWRRTACRMRRSSRGRRARLERERTLRRDLRLGRPAGLPQEFLDQLKIGGRLAAFVGSAPVMKAQIITRVDEKQFRVADIFETLIPNRSITPCSRRASSSVHAWFHVRTRAALVLRYCDESAESVASCILVCAGSTGGPPGSPSLTTFTGIHAKPVRTRTGRMARR